MKIFLLILTMISFVACSKKREESFVQGQGENLSKIQDYDQKEFNVETLEFLTDYKENFVLSKSEAESQKIKTREKKPSSLQFGAVKIKTDATLVGDTPFIAQSFRKEGYKIRYQINKDFLVVYKVAEKKLLHPSELSGAVDFGKGQLGIPLLGYPIQGFIKVENVDDNGAKSNKLIEKNVDDKSKAEYFKFDIKNRIVYKFQEKMDVFSKLYFTGADNESEWYYAQTIIGTDYKGAENLGMMLSQTDQQLNSLTKVKFFLSRNELRAVSVNVDKKININDEVNQTVIAQFPIEWKDYRPQPTSQGGIAMQEEENNAIQWDQRNYIKLNIESSKTIDYSSPTQKFVDIEVDENYFSYTLYDSAYKVRIKQSFMRNKDRKIFKAKKMFKSDFEKFGFFSTQQHEINGYEKYYVNDYDNNIFVNRFNVNLGSVDFYFTEGSDENLIPMAAKAADEWNEAFQKAGIALKVKAITDPSKRVKLGDIRYNQINLIRTAQSSNLFGYGPTTTDPQSGEIISATTNIHLTSIVDALVSHIREYLEYKSGLTKNLSLFTLPPLMPESPLVLNDKAFAFNLSSDSQQAFRFIKKFPKMEINGKVTPVKVFSPESVESETLSVQLSRKNKGSVLNDLQKRNKNWGREFDISVTGKYLNQDIDEKCSELSEVASSINQETGIPSDSQSNQKIIACAEKLLPEKMFGTLLHEMGHNFGLRHNFYGSIDVLNFWKKDLTRTKDVVKTSSVMEYPAFGEDRLTKVGLYDIAALRYGYGDRVETEECVSSESSSSGCREIVLDVQKSIDENLQIKNAKRKSYLFCTDEDIQAGNDPLCARHDAGTNADEIAQNLINEYNSSVSHLNYRFNRYRKYYSDRIQNYRLRAFWVPMKKIYDEWRFRLADVLGPNSGYLDNYDVQSLKNEFEKKTKRCDFEKDPNSSECQLKFYDRAAERIFNFAFSVAALPPKYCVGFRNQKVAAVEFTEIRRVLMANLKFVAKNCLEPQVVKYIETENGFTPQMETGYELDDVRLNMRVKMSGMTDWFGNPIPEPADIIGLMPDKYIATEILTARASMSPSAQQKTVEPNFLDEPRFREKILSYLSNRIGSGIPLQQIMTKKEKNPGFIEKFKYENKFIQSFADSVLYGLDIPYKRNASLIRKEKFLLKYTDKKEQIENAIAKFPSLDGVNWFVVLDKSATEAIGLIKKLEQIHNRLQKAVPVKENTFEALKRTIEKKFPDDENTAISPESWAAIIHFILEDQYSIQAMTTTNYVRPKDEKENDRNRLHWKKIFSREVSFMQKELSTLAASAEDVSSSNFNWSVFYAVNGEKMVNEIKSKDTDYKMTKKIAFSLIEKYLKDRIGNQSRSDDEFEFDDLQQQYEMILDLLRSFTF